MSLSNALSGADLASIFFLMLTSKLGPTVLLLSRKRSVKRLSFLSEGALFSFSRKFISLLLLLLLLLLSGQTAAAAAAALAATCLGSLKPPCIQGGSTMLFSLLRALSPCLS